MEENLLQTDVEYSETKEPEQVSDNSEKSEVSTAQNQPKLHVRFSDGVVETIPLKRNKNKSKIQALDQPDFWSYVHTK